jgi:tryptophan synthase alpha chain
MSRYNLMFSRLKEKNEGAFIPFTVLHDPDEETSLVIMDTLIKAGADALELGLAFSDPLADGPTIQKADLRALRSGSTTKKSLGLVKKIRSQYPDIPLGLLTYANIVFNQTLDGFYKQCHDAGLDSVVVADVPMIEAKPYCEAAIKNNIDPILLAPINLPQKRYQEIAKMGRGFTYVVTRNGVTGADKEINLYHNQMIKDLEKLKAPPAIFGFGISKPQHIRQALKEGAKGAISGSKTVQIIEEHLNNKSEMLKQLTIFADKMKSASKHMTDI